MDEIPADAAVSAQSPFVPHLALRDDIFLFPKLGNAEYLLLSAKENPFPLEKPDMTARLSEYLQAPEWELVQEVDSTFLFHKLP